MIQPIHRRIGQKYILLPGFLLLCLFLFFSPASSSAQAIQTPTIQQPTIQAADSCRLGIYLVDLYALDPGNKSFNADMWLWSNCPNDVLQPLKRIEYKNANAVTSDLYNMTQEKGIYWEQLKVTGTFRQAWDVRDYPFDRHILEVVIEESTRDIRKFVYVPDNAESHYNPRINLEGWRIESFKLVGTKDIYSTTFGDPSLEAGSGSTYSQLRVQIVVTRSSFSNFFKLMAPAYVSFVLTVITFFLALDSALSLGLLAGVLFVVVVSIRDVSDTLGSASGLTLADQIHVVVLLYIMEAVVIAIISRQMQEHEKPAEQINRLNLRCFWTNVLSFILINLALIGWAIYSG